MLRIIIIFAVAGIFSGMFPQLLQAAEQSIFNDATLQKIWSQETAPEKAAELLQQAFENSAIPPALAGDIDFQLRKFIHRTKFQHPAWSYSLYREFNSLARYAVLLKMRENLPDIPLVLVGSSSSNIPENDCQVLKSFSAFPTWHAKRGKKFQAIIAALPNQHIRGLTYEFTQLESSVNSHNGNVRIQYHSLVYQFFSNRWICRKELIHNPAHLGKGMQLYLLNISLPQDMPAGEYNASVQINARTPGINAVLQYKLIVK